MDKFRVRDLVEFYPSYSYHDEYKGLFEILIIETFGKDKKLYYHLINIETGYKCQEFDYMFAKSKTGMVLYG